MGLKTKEEFEIEIKEVFDNLNKSQFNKLLIQSLVNIYFKAYGNKEIANKIFKSDFSKYNDGKSQGELIKLLPAVKLLEFKDEFDTLAVSVFATVAETRRISFKQFKLLSAFCKLKWNKDTQPKEEFKQF